MRINFKILLLAALSVIAIAAFVVSVKFSNLAKNIYEFENPSQTQIIDQFKQVVMKDETTIKTNPDGTTNILLMGIAGPGHNGENLTDTIMVATISSDRKNIALSSIPRDLYVEMPAKHYWSRINAIYASNSKEDSKEGVKALAGKIKEISGLSINYYVIADFAGFKKLVDEVGGIDYTLDTDLYDPGFPNDSFGYEPLYLKAGTYHLDGAMALKLSRSRHTAKGDFSRIDRQHKIVKALVEELEKQKIWSNFFAVNNILSIISENIKTNITLPEFQKLNDIAKNMNSNDIISRIPDTDINRGVLYAAKINEANVLLPKDPTYEELKAFYQGKVLIKEEPKEELGEQQTTDGSESNNIGSENQNAEISEEQPADTDESQPTASPIAESPAPASDPIDQSSSN